MQFRIPTGSCVPLFWLSLTLVLASCGSASDRHQPSDGSNPAADQATERSSHTTIILPFLDDPVGAYAQLYVEDPNTCERMAFMMDQQQITQAFYAGHRYKPWRQLNLADKSLKLGEMGQITGTCSVQFENDPKVYRLQFDLPGFYEPGGRIQCTNPDGSVQQFRPGAIQTRVQAGHVPRLFDQEQKAMKQAGGGAERYCQTLVVKPQAGKPVTFRDRLVPGDGVYYHTYRHYYPHLNLHLVRTQYYEGGAITLIHHPTGQTIEHEFSPNPIVRGPHVLLYESGVMNGNPQAVLYKVTQAGFRKTFDQPLAVDSVVWDRDQTLELHILDFETMQSGKIVRLEQQNGQWKARSGE